MQGIPIFHLGPTSGYEFRAATGSGDTTEWLLQVLCSSPHENREVSPDELVEFANCKDAVEAVHRYIGRFGPPFLFPDPKDGLIYAELLGRWKGLQVQFCMTWDGMIGIEINHPLWEAVKASGEFRLIDRKPVFVAETHYMALVAKLLMVASTGRLRKCLNPHCAVTPYFIAEHGKTQYCSEDCGRWGQRQAKNKYWHGRHGSRPGTGKPKTAQGKKEAD